MLTPEQINDPNYPDPIVAEVRRIREEISAESGHDFLLARRRVKQGEIEDLKAGRRIARIDLATQETVPVTVAELEADLKRIDSRMAARNRGEAA